MKNIIYPYISINDLFLLAELLQRKWLPDASKTVKTVEIMVLLFARQYEVEVVYKVYTGL